MNDTKSMNSVRQAWLVAKREIRERGRSRAFLASVLLMIAAVTAMLVLPVLFTSGGARDVGLSGPAPARLAATISQQARAATITVRIHHYPSLASGERAVRDGRIDVLVAGAWRLEWRGRPDNQLKAAVTAAIQLVTVQQRATTAGISPGTMRSLLAPVPVTSVELGHVTGRGPADETAVIVMTGVLLFCISVFGSMVLTGVLEEKSSRVVEVLLAHMPARSLLAGKIAGIGLLGLAQIAVTALAALVAVTAAGSVDVPAVRATVLAWALVWFVLGYVLYATVYGTLGSLGSRAEDAQSAAAPATAILVVSYFAAFAMIAQPASAAARVISFFPLTAPMAMPGRIAMGATAWWEPVAAALVTLATIAALVAIGGRIYTSAILHSGPALSLRAAWQNARTPGSRTTAGTGALSATALPQRGDLRSGGRTTMTTDLTSHRLLITVLTGIGIALGVTAALLTRDVIAGVIAAAGFIAVTIQMVKLWARHQGPPTDPAKTPADNRHRGSPRGARSACWDSWPLRRDLRPLARCWNGCSAGISSKPAGAGSKEAAMNDVRMAHPGWARAVAIAAAMVIAAHGLVHLMGVSLLWKLGEPGQLRYADAVPAPGSAAAYVVGGLWLVAAALFVTAAVLLAAGRPAWRLIALAGIVMSAPVIGLAPGQAVAGLVVDGLVLLLVAVGWLRARAVRS
jgi:ABC-2 type transport system permease protein